MRKTFNFLKRHFRAMLLLVALAWMVYGLPANAGTQIGGEFTLTDGTGQTVTNRDFQGRFLLVFFGATNGPDLCTATIYKISEALSIMGATPARLQVLFITLDPARDTPDVVSRYATLFSPDILGLTGSTSQIAQAAADYYVFAALPAPETGAIAPSQLAYLMGPDGKFIAALPESGSADMLATRLTALMSRS